MTIYDRDGNLIPEELQGISMSMELITPEKAEKFLDNMTKNRHVRNAQMNKYKTDLENGDFVFCPAPIIFNQEGKMVDGQHRCKAVCESGEPFWGIVLYNVPNGLVIDKGAQRSTGDELYMQGVLDEETSRAPYIALARNYLEAKYGRVGRQATDAQIGRFINSYSDDMFLAITISGQGSSASIGKNASVQSALFAAIRCGASCDRLEEFMRVVNSGFATSADESAAIVLRNMLLDYNVHGGRSMQKRLTPCIEHAIKDFIDGKPRKQIYKDHEHIYINESDAILK